MRCIGKEREMDALRRGNDDDDDDGDDIPPIPAIHRANKGKQGTYSHPPTSTRGQTNSEVATLVCKIR
jgi:hypothetical protein